MPRRIPSTSSIRFRPPTLAEQLARGEGEVDQPAPARPAAATRERLEAAFAALELALTAPARSQLAQRHAARQLTGDRLPLRVGLLLQAEQTLRAVMEVIEAEVVRRIALRDIEVNHLLRTSDEDLGPFLPPAEQERLEAFAANAPSLPSMRGVPGDHEPDPPDPWESVPEPDPYDQYRDAAEHALGIADARQVIALAEDAPAVRAALVRWADEEGLLGGMNADTFLASDAQVREHLDGFRFDLELLATLHDRRDVAFGSVATQIAWGREVRVLGPRSAELILGRLRIPANHSGT